MKYIFLGIVQGITEFLPVSSSGHLVIFQEILGVDGNVIFLDVVLHLGTLCSLVIFFRREIYILISNFIIYGRRRKRNMEKKNGFWQISN